MRVINWLTRVLATVAQGTNAAVGGGPGAPLDTAQKQAEADAAHRRRRDYRP
ncbi:hypothetical protein [Curtobacterium sp. MCBD17_040]|uniref:hypothetical protein n=1 Tax=Curtobacterium sp. MCBD17_040 TaxID=2175674 RepID=UPI0015E891BB|nr:hypothetical protein [Curtobacterium sp. MCBD17_040]WIB65880.1 hypothetical protein DEI94_17345 [Curtobacterium sp. MCBD17_040]